jgi:site-specific recombinase XerD
MASSEKLQNYINRFELVYTDSTHPQENRQAIKRFMRKVAHSGVKETTQKTDYSVFTVFSKWCTIPMESITEDDLYDFLDYLNTHTFKRSGKISHYSETTIHTTKIILKMFFKDIGKTELAEILKTKLMPINTENNEKRNLLTKEEIDSLISNSRFEQKHMWKTVKFFNIS